MKNMKSFDKAFLTGCDKNTEWMLPWFLSNYSENNNTPIVFANFGVSPKMLEYATEHFDDVLDLTETTEKGWFKKPTSMLKSNAKKTVWLDTDCQVLGDISKIFDLIEADKLAMVQDKPWTKRRGEKWFNSGVVGFEGKPQILKDWRDNVIRNPIQGDQEVLHSMLGPITQVRYITELPNEFNWLRLQLENDNQDSPRKKIMHWTGQKGKDRIRSMLNA